MGFLNNIYSKYVDVKNTTTYPAYYQYWIEQLFERVLRIFVWDTGDDIIPKEIEQNLALNGHCFVCKYNGDLTVFAGSMSGITKYYDEFTHYNVRSPLYSNILNIEKYGVVINNNKLRNPTFDLCQHYAQLLAHADVTIALALVDARRQSGTPVVKNILQANSIDDYYKQIYNGKFAKVTDKSLMGVEYVGDNSKKQDLMELMLVKERLLRSFYSDIGVKSSFDKKSNTVSEEVEADNTLLLLNISDMIDSRKKACEKINNTFGVNWTVEVNPEIKYEENNESYTDIQSVQTE